MSARTGSVSAADGALPREWALRPICTAGAAELAPRPLGGLAAGLWSCCCHFGSKGRAQDKPGRQAQRGVVKERVGLQLSRVLACHQDWHPACQQQAASVRAPLLVH